MVAVRWSGERPEPATGSQGGPRPQPPTRSLLFGGPACATRPPSRPQAELVPVMDRPESWLGFYPGDPLSVRAFGRSDVAFLCSSRLVPALRIPLSGGPTG